MMFHRGARSILALTLGIALWSCGGGGGDDDSPTPPQTQTIAFADAGPVYKFIDDAPFDNPVTGGSGSGAITYSSDDPTVATIDADSGEITVVAPGSTTIVANKAADGRYTPAQAQFILQVAPRIVTAEAWIKEDSTTIAFDPTAVGLQFARSTDLHCDASQAQDCANGLVSTLDSADARDSTATLSREAGWWLRHGNFVSTPIVVPHRAFPVGTPQSGAVSFKGRLWALGLSATSAYSNEVWSSVDGVNWIPEIVAAPFSPRRDGVAVVFAEKIWVLGGFLENGQPGDVWSSPDGVSWSLVDAAPEFGYRTNYGVAAFGDHLYVIGGLDGTQSPVNDVWSSTDGSDWNRLTPGAPFSGRWGMGICEFNGRLFVVGGYDNGVINDVWSSADGVDWRLETAAAADTGHSQHTVASYAGRLWMLGGYNDYISQHGDVWSSADGITWRLERQFSQLRLAHYAVVHDGRLWIVGPFPGAWSTTDGKEWKDTSTQAPFEPRSQGAATVFNDRLWVIGGGPGGADVWSSANGTTWQRSTPWQGAPFPPRYSHQILAFQNALWVIGGSREDTGTNLNDVWKSTDGEQWTQVTAAADFLPRFSHAAVVFDDKLWVIGGITLAPDFARDVWVSANGQDWTLVTAATPFDYSAAYRAVSFNGRMWVVAVDGNNGYTFWSSSDGAQWTRESASPLFAGLGDIEIGVHAGRMWTTMSAGFYSPKEVWSSADGRSWTRVSSSGHVGNLQSLRGEMYAIGAASQLAADTSIWKSKDGVRWALGFRVETAFKPQP